MRLTPSVPRRISKWLATMVIPVAVGSCAFDASTATAEPFEFTVALQASFIVGETRNIVAEAEDRALTALGRDGVSSTATSTTFTGTP